MLKVGLTGGLASGKTFVADVLAELGCRVIHADRLGHEVIEPDGEAYADVVREFGQEIVGTDGRIDRRRLGNLVFPDPQRLEVLNSLVHPHVFRRQQQFFERIAREDPRVIAVVEAAIMIESGSYKRYDRLVVAVCPVEAQIERYRRRENATEQEARDRLARQMPLEDKRKYADYVIDTSGTTLETGEQARRVYQELRKQAL